MSDVNDVIVTGSGGYGSSDGSRRGTAHFWVTAAEEEMSLRCSALSIKRRTYDRLEKFAAMGAHGIDRAMVTLRF